MPLVSQTQVILPKSVLLSKADLHPPRIVAFASSSAAVQRRLVLPAEMCRCIVTCAAAAWHLQDCQPGRPDAGCSAHLAPRCRATACSPKRPMSSFNSSVSPPFLSENSPSSSDSPSSPSAAFASAPKSSSSALSSSFNWASPASVWSAASAAGSTGWSSTTKDLPVLTEK